MIITAVVIIMIIKYIPYTTHLPKPIAVYPLERAPNALLFPRVRRLQGGAGGGAGPDRPRPAVAHLVLQVRRLQHRAARGVHGQVSTRPGGLPWVARMRRGG